MPVAETTTSRRFELRPFGFRTVSVTANLPALGKTYVGFLVLAPAPVFPNLQDHVAGDPLERSVKYTGSPGRGDCGVHVKFASGNPQEGGGVGVGVRVAVGVEGGTTGVDVGVGRTGVGVRVGVWVAVGGVGTGVGVRVGEGGTGDGVRVGVAVQGIGVGVRLGVRVAVAAFGEGVAVGVAVGGIAVAVRVGVGVSEGPDVGVRVGVMADEIARTTNTLNSGPVGLGTAKPTGFLIVRPAKGSETVPPE